MGRDPQRPFGMFRTPAPLPQHHCPSLLGLALSGLQKQLAGLSVRRDRACPQVGSQWLLSPEAASRMQLRLATLRILDSLLSP